MEKSAAEQVVDFLIEFVPDALPKPFDSAAKAALKTWGDPRLRQKLLDAARQAESDFRGEAREKMKNDELVQAIASFPLFDRELFQQALRSLPQHLNEDLIAEDLETLVSDDWKGKFTPAELREGIAIYMVCLRNRLLEVEGFGDLVAKLAILRTDNRTVKIEAGIGELLRRTKTYPVHAPRKKATIPVGLPIGSYLPFTRNVLFTGREEDIQKLENSLLGKKPSSALISQAITGRSGIGKTQLAVEFAYRNADKFKSIHWLDMHDLATLNSQIAQCGVQMMLKHWPLELPKQVILTLAAWKGKGPRLLILDNFEDPKTGPEILSRFQDPNLRLLITSQSSDWPSLLGHKPHQLEVFAEKESIELLLKYTNDIFPPEQLKELAGRLGHLPLTLELAGRYLEKHEHLTIEQFITKLDETLDDEAIRGFLDDIPDPTRYDSDLLSTFFLSWEQVKDETIRKLFMTAGYCAPNVPIPLEILEKTLKLDNTNCDGALNVLMGLGLLRENATIHPLLAEYARFLDRENSILSLLLKGLADIAIERNVEVDRTGNYSLYSPLFLHVHAVAETAEVAQIQKAESLWNSLGYYNLQLADYTSAKAAFERSLKIDKAALGSDPIIESINYEIDRIENKDEKNLLRDDLQSILLIDKIYFFARNRMEKKGWNEAIELLHEVELEISKRNQFWNLRINQDLGYAFYSNVSFSSALSYYILALANTHQLNNTKDVEGLLNIRIGDLYRRRGGKNNCEEAREYYNNAKEIYVNLPDNLFKVADCNRKIAGSWIFEGRPDIAIELCEKNLLFCRKENYISGYYKALQHKAWAYSILGYWNESIQLFEEAFQLAEGSWDKIKALRYLGDAYRIGGRFLEAEKRYEQALSFIIKNEWGFSRTGGLIMLGLAKIYMTQQGSEAKAQKYLINGLEAHGGQDEDFCAIEFYVERGRLFLKQGMYKEAGEFLKLARDKYSELNNIINYINALVPLAELAYKEKDLEELEEIEKDAIEKSNGLINYYLAQIYFTHGKAIIEQDRDNFQNAAEVWVKALEKAIEFNSESFRVFSEQMIVEIKLVAKDMTPDEAQKFTKSFYDLWESKLSNKQWQGIDQEVSQKLLRIVRVLKKEAEARTYLK